MLKRIDYLDAAKGIGMLFVILGHNQIKQTYPIVFQVVYSFHMPFFFLLSGMFFKTDYGFIELARRRFSSLLKPFIAYTIMIYGALIFFSNMDLLTVARRMLKSLYAGSNSLEWLPMWFLPHLFLVNLFAYFVVKYLYDRLPQLWMRLVCLLVLLWSGVVTLHLFWPVTFTLFDHPYRVDGLPWSADLLLVTTAFFIFGYEIRRTFSNSFNLSGVSRWVFIGTIVVFAGLNAVFQDRIDFYARQYDSFMVNTLEAVSGSIMLLYLAQWLEGGSKRIFSAMKYLGAISIILLIFHYVPMTFLYDKLIALQMHPVLASILSFLAGILVPILLTMWVIQPNSFLASWFGMSRPQKQDATEVTDQKQIPA
jgi:fucose 4-O-acetylase-like acetyltransferase